MRDARAYKVANIPLELDHIDGRCDNNSIANLRLICSNWHARTPTYRGRNKGCDDTAETLYPDHRHCVKVIARVVKLVDTRHLKCLAGETGMPVRFRPRAPL
jgi:hypothetical protein